VGTGGGLALLALAIIGGVGIFALTRGKAKASSTKPTPEPVPNPGDDEFDPDDLIPDELFSGRLQLSVTTKGNRPSSTAINKIAKVMLNDLETGAFVANVGCEDAPVLQSVKQTTVVKIDDTTWRIVYDFKAEFIDEPVDFLPKIGECVLKLLRTPEVTSNNIAKSIVGVRVRRTK
jgi:hypothetical protein